MKFSDLFVPWNSTDVRGLDAGTSTPEYSIINIHEFLTGSDRELLTYNWGIHAKYDIVGIWRIRDYDFFTVSFFDRGYSFAGDSILQMDSLEISSLGWPLTRWRYIALGIHEPLHP
jgi:hypothetical protein